MAALPPCSLCRPSEFVQKNLENNKKPFLIYSIFLILLVEWFSFFYIKYFNVAKPCTDFYTSKMYPFLSQLCLFILFFSIFLWKDRLHFCFRKSATTFYLSAYYLLNCLAILLCFNASIYYEILAYSTLGIASLLFLVSFAKNND